MDSAGGTASGRAFRFFAGAYPLDTAAPAAP